MCCTTKVAQRGVKFPSGIKVCLTLGRIEGSESNRNRDVLHAALQRLLCRVDGLERGLLYGLSGILVLMSSRLAACMDSCGPFSQTARSLALTAWRSRECVQEALDSFLTILDSVVSGGRAGEPRCLTLFPACPSFVLDLSAGVWGFGRTLDLSIRWRTKQDDKAVLCRALPWCAMLCDAGWCGRDRRGRRSMCGCLCT